MKPYKLIVTMDEKDIMNVEKHCIHLEHGDKSEKVPALPLIDVIEVRLDLMSKLFIKNELPVYLRRFKKSVLFTYRKSTDASLITQLDLAFPDIEDLLYEFNNPENYVDIEIDSNESIFLKLGDTNINYNVILSYHNFEKTLRGIEIMHYINMGLKNFQFNYKPIFKFAVTPQSLDELFHFLLEIKAISSMHKMIGVAMGEIGSLSRAFGDKFGCSYSYACLEEPKAPGQITMEMYYKLRHPHYF